MLGHLKPVFGALRQCIGDGRAAWVTSNELSHNRVFPWGNHCLHIFCRFKFGPSWRHPGPIRAIQKPILDLCCSFVGICWRILGSCREQARPATDSLGPGERLPTRTCDAASWDPPKDAEQRSLGAEGLELPVLRSKQWALDVQP
jgi:hypothetical protein